MRVLIAIFVCLLPERYRQRLGLYHVPTAAGVFSGVLETLLFLSLIGYRYLAFMNARMAIFHQKVLLTAAEKAGETLIMGLGQILLFEYLLQPLTMVLGFFVAEGLVRTYAALGAGEMLPSLPLKLLSLLQARLVMMAGEIKRGRRVRDRVEAASDGESLRVVCCRAKPWDRMATICYQGQLYEVADERKAPPPRRFVYVLRKKQLSTLIRSIQAYDPGGGGGAISLRQNSVDRA
jgi:hypothetical protein